MIGNDGFTPAVAKETELALKSHGLIKIRVLGDDRDAREQMFLEICDQLNAAPIQHIGKLLVIWHSRTGGSRALAGAEVEAVYHCPHHPKGQVAEWAVECDCRKPAPGMILRAAKELGVSLADSFLVGDKPSDIEAARAAGVGRAYIVQSDNAESSGGHAQADAAFRDLADCVAHLLSAPAT